MLTLYSIPTSLYCAKLRILLRHKGLTWREIPPPDGYGSDAYSQIVPSGSIPALIDGDLLLSDSEAIAEYLNETHPDPPMLPGDNARCARIRERSRFHDTRLEPLVRALFPFLAGKPHTAEHIVAAGHNISAKLDQLDRLLALAPPEQQLTLGDCGFPITFLWIEALQETLGLPISWPQGLLAWSQRLGGHAAIAEELASYRPAVTNWLAQRQG